MAKCLQCKRNSTKNRLVADGLCNECNPPATPINVDYAAAPCNADDTLGDIKFKDFVEWMLDVFVKCVKESVSIELAECNKQITTVKEQLSTVRNDLKTANEDVKTLKEEMKTMKKEREEETKTSKDNLRYLINHDRSARQRNVLLFGVQDDDVITLGEETFNSDRAAVREIFEKIEVGGDVKVTEVFRLGKKKNAEDDDGEGNGRQRSRPIKICFESSNMAKTALAKSSKLKELFQGNDTNVYMKSDKSKSERDEYTR